jgi:hypothetical protein
MFFIGQGPFGLGSVVAHRVDKSEDNSTGRNSQTNSTGRKSIVWKWPNLQVFLADLFLLAVVVSRRDRDQRRLPSLRSGHEIPQPERLRAPPELRPAVDVLDVVCALCVADDASASS